ncbi:MAG: GAF domain-containing protein [Planctomycetota bacterium]
MSSLLEEKKLYHRAKILSEALLLSSRAPDYKSVLRMVTKHFKVFTEADAAVLMLNNHQGSLVPVFSLGMPLSKIKDTHLPSTIRLKDILTHPVLDVRYTSFMNTPLIHNRELLGIAAVFSTMPEKFQIFEHDRYENLFLSMLAGHTSLTIECVTLADTLKLIECTNADWKNIADAVEDLICVCDLNSIIIKVNRALTKKVRMDGMDIVGRKCCDVFHHNETPPKTYPCCATPEAKSAYTEGIEYPMIHGVFNVATFPFFDELDKHVGNVHVARDTTRVKKLQHQDV